MSDPERTRQIEAAHQEARWRMGELADRIAGAPGGARFLERVSFLMGPENHRRPLPGWLRRDGGGRR